MIKTLYLTYLLTICSFQFSSIAHAQFLPSVDTNGGPLNFISSILSAAAIIAEEEEFLIDENEQLDWNNAEDNLEFNKNTPEEIQAALSENIANILKAYGQFILSQSIIQQTQNPEIATQNPEVALIQEASATAYINTAKPIGDALGSLVADGVSAFRAAQETGEDAGAAVSAVVVKTLLQFNTSAESIGDALQKELNSTLANKEDVSDMIYEAFDTVGKSAQRFVNAVANRADAIGVIVAQTVNDVASQGESLAEQLGNAFAGLMQAFMDHAEDVGDIVSEAMIGLDGAGAEQFSEIKSAVVTAIHMTNTSPEEFGSGITEMINLISGDKVFGTPAQSVVEIINRLGQLFVLSIAQETAIKSDS